MVITSLLPSPIQNFGGVLHSAASMSSIARCNPVVEEAFLLENIDYVINETILKFRQKELSYDNASLCPRNSQLLNTMYFITADKCFLPRFCYRAKMHVLTMLNTPRF